MCPCVTGLGHGCIPAGALLGSSLQAAVVNFGKCESIQNLRMLPSGAVANPALTGPQLVHFC